MSRAARSCGAAVLLAQDERWDGSLQKRAWYVHNLVTAVGASGAGKAILRAAEKLAKVRGMEAIRLDCIEGNEPLNAWYEAQGYFLTRYLHKTARTTEFSARSCSEEGPAVFWAERKPDATHLACYLFVHCGN